MKAKTTILSRNFSDKQTFLFEFIAKLINFPNNLLMSLLGLILSVPVAWAIYQINYKWSDQPEKAVLISGGLLALLAIAPPVFYLVIRGWEAKVNKLGLQIIGTFSVLLVAVYLFWISFYIMFPADIFIWSESDFVNDILKFRQSYPIFTAQVNNESFTYVPGSQLITYFLAWLISQPTSIPTYRAIQVGYSLLSAIVAFFCCRRLINFALPGEQKIENSSWLGIIWLSVFFLIATNSLTNPFTHLLHNDALAQLAIITSYWLLLEYEATKNKKILYLMALVPGFVFWIKQSLIIWAILYCGYLLFFDRTSSFKRVFYFTLASLSGVFVSVFIGYALWEKDFIYWAFTVLGAHGVSPLRSFKHLLDIWLYFVIGLIGGAFLLEIAGLKRLFGFWLIWLILISMETYTSGIAWMLNHIGPGCLIAGVWFFAALSVVWAKITDSSIKTSTAKYWLQTGVALTVLCLLFNGLAIIRMPVQPFNQDAYRYFAEIENEFAKQAPERTLLDLGTWVYLPSGSIMKDRAPSIGERGYSQTGDFSGILQRLEEKYYSKILVRNFHSGDFWYDHESWKKSSQIRETLKENYVEVGKIEQLKGLNKNDLPYGFSEISILVPRKN